MKKLLFGLLIGLGLIAGSVYAQQSVFRSFQIGTSPSNGRILQTDGTVSTWISTSTLGITIGGATSTNPFMATYFVSTSTIATSTFAGALQIGGTAGDNALKITAGRVYPSSDSVGGMVRLTNTLNSGSALGIYTNYGASATNDLMIIQSDNTAYARRAFRIKQDGTGGAGLFDCLTSAGVNECLNITSTDVDTTALGVSSYTDDHGAVKVTLVDADGIDGNGSNAAASLFSGVLADASQGIFMTANSGVGSSTGKFLQFRNFDNQFVYDLHHDGRMGIWESGGVADAMIDVTATSTYDYLHFGGGSILSVLNNGNVGLGTSTPGTLLSLGNTGADTINISPTATSTFGSGLNLRTGCFSINGTCLSSGGGLQTPWTSAIDGGGYALTNAGAITGTVLNATSTTATSTFPKLRVATVLDLFGTVGTALSDFCTAITGGAGLCDGDDATGGGGGAGNSKWATSTADSTAIHTAGALRVGIGTTSPMSTFAVVGTTTLATTTTSMINGMIVVDGVHYAQDGTGIQNAINDQAARGGGTVYLPAKTYLANATITIPKDSHVRLLGEKSVKATTGGTKIQANASMTSLISMSSGFATINDDLSHDFAIDNIYLEGNAGNATTCVLLHNADFVKIQNFRIRGCINAIKMSYEGIHPQDSFSAPGGMFIETGSIGVQDNQSGRIIDIENQTQIWLNDVWFSGAASTSLRVASSTKVHAQNLEFNGTDVAVSLEDSASFATNDVTVNNSTFVPGSGKTTVSWNLVHANSCRNIFVGNTWASGSMSGTIADCNDVEFKQDVHITGDLRTTADVIASGAMNATGNITTSGDLILNRSSQSLTSAYDGITTLSTGFLDYMARGSQRFYIDTNNNDSSTFAFYSVNTSNLLFDIDEAGEAYIKTNLGIATTTPAWRTQIVQTTAPQLALTDSGAGTNLKHWTMRSAGGNLYFATSTDAFATSTKGLLELGPNTYVGSSGKTASVYGSMYVLGNTTNTPPGTSNGPFSAAASGNFVSSCENCGGSSLGNLMVIANFGAGASGINTFNARGVTSAPTATQSGDDIYFMGGRGFGSTVWNSGSRAVINMEATQNFTDTAHGTSIDFETTPNDSTTRTLAMTIDHTQNIGMGSSTPWRKLSVVGTMAVNGLSAGGAGDVDVCINGTTFDITNAGATACIVSSIRFKENLVPLEGSLSKILQLNPVGFNYKPEMDSSPVKGKKRVGLIAEDMEKVEPRLVNYEEDEVTPRGIDYESYTALLTGAIKELNEKVEGGVTTTKKSAADNWQWGFLLALTIMVIKQQLQINRLKK